MAIAYVGSGDIGANTSTTSLSNSYTCGSGSLRLLVVGITGDLTSGNDDITGVTYNGVSMTLVAKMTTGSNRFCYQYYLVNPASGANTLTVNCTNAHFLSAVAADYSGVKATGQPDNSTTNLSVNGNDTTLTTSLTTANDNSWCVLVESCWEAGNAPTAGTHSTLRVANGTYGMPALFDSNGVVTPAGSFSMTTNEGNNQGQFVYHIMASYQPDTGGGGGTTFPTHYYNQMRAT